MDRVIGDEFLSKQFKIKKSEIKNTLLEHKKFGHESSKEDLFAEIAYCICTPQSFFENCQSALSELKLKNLLFSFDEDVIGFILKKNGVRFHNKKAAYIVQARTQLYDDNCPHEIRGLVQHLLSLTQQEARDFLWQINVRGLGMKEISHYLRNIGHGDDLAILDIHIINKLLDYGIIKKQPTSAEISRSYEIIEEHMRKWSKNLGISLGELDILLWCT